MSKVSIFVLSISLILVVLTLVLRKCKREGFALLQLTDNSWNTKGKDGAQGQVGEKYTIIDEDINSIVERVTNELINKKDDKENPMLVNPKNYLDVLPEGTILMWGYNEVPRGWARCNGKNGTIDLRGRVPMGLHNFEYPYRYGKSEHKDSFKIIGKIGGWNKISLFGGAYAAMLNFNTAAPYVSAQYARYPAGEVVNGHDRVLTGLTHPLVPAYTAVQFIQKLPKEEYSADNSGRVDGYRNLEENLKFDYIENDRLPHDSTYKYPEGY